MGNSFYFLLLIYDPSKLESCIKDFYKVIYPKVHLGNNRFKIIVINNSDIELSCNDPKVEVIGGDNSVHKFSGWQKGVEYLMDVDDITGDDVIIFAHDNCNINYGTEWFKWLSRRHFFALIGNYGLMGAVSTYSDYIRIGENIKRGWIRTNLFATNFRTLKKIGSISYPYKEVFSDKNEIFRKDTELISENYKHKINHWLIQDYIDPNAPEAPKWYKAKKISDSNFKELRVKAHCLLSEMYLTAQIQNLDGKIINVMTADKNKKNFLFKYIIFSLSISYYRIYSLLTPHFKGRIISFFRGYFLPYLYLKKMIFESVRKDTFQNFRNWRKGFAEMSGLESKSAFKYPKIDCKITKYLELLNTNNVDPLIVDLQKEYDNLIISDVPIHLYETYMTGAFGRIFQLLKELREFNQKTLFLYIGPVSKKDKYCIGKIQRLYGISFVSLHNFKPTKLNDLNIDSKLKLKYTEYEFKCFLERACTLSKQVKFKNVICEYLWNWPFLEVFNYEKSFLDLHDLFHERSKSYLKYGQKPGIYINEKNELRIFSKFDNLLAISRVEENSLINLGVSKEKVSYLPWVETNYRLDRQPKAKVLGFLGTSQPSNIQGMKWFLKNCWPDLKKEGFELRLFGSIVNSFQNYKYSKVYNIGFVQNKNNIFEQIDIFISPIFSGSGIKTKTLEALSFGLPVVSTTEGAQGIKEESMLIADDVQSFIGKIKEIRNDEVTKLHLSDASISYIQSEKVLLNKKVEKLFI